MTITESTTDVELLELVASTKVATVHAGQTRGSTAIVSGNSRAWTTDGTVD